MSIYLIPYDHDHGAELDVFITAPASIFPEDIVKFSRRKVRLMIDTGANRTAISPKILRDMGLTSNTKTTLRTAGQDQETYLYHIDLMCDRMTPPLIMPDLVVSEFKAQWREGVLGRDFLKLVVLEISDAAKQAKIIT